jgi:YesN/AraC family two-component response regulator
MGELRVLIADDEEMVRGGLRMVIEAQPDLAVVGEAADGREAVEAVRRTKPDVAR